MSSFESEEEDFGTSSYETEQEGSDRCDLTGYISRDSQGCSEEIADVPEENEEEEEEDELDDCCKCPPKQNRFLISFQNTSRLGEICLDESRIKCKAFWTFIDANPELQKVVKEGRSPAPPSPIPFDICHRICSRPGFSSKNDVLLRACRSPSQLARSAKALPIQVKFRADEERRRFHYRQAAVIALQLKSGQPIFTAKRETLPNYRNVYADEVPEIQVIPSWCPPLVQEPLLSSEKQEN